MPISVSHRTQQSHAQIVDIASWKADEESPIFPVGSKPKRLVRCPNPAPFPFLIRGHRYLYKTAQDWRSQQSWSEVLAYEISRELKLNVPPAFIAVDSSDGSVGVLIEFFYGYPDDVAPPQLLHGTDLLQRMRRGRSYDPTIDRPHSIQMNIRVASTVGAPAPAEWWAQAVAFDALIGNVDRHPQNWGFLVSRIEPEKVEMELTPIFDNGTSLGYERTDADLVEAWSPDKLIAYIKRGRHHCSWRTDSTTGEQHAQLCKDVASHSIEASDAVRSVILLDDSKIDEITGWCAGFDAPLVFSEARALFVSQQLKARRDAISTAIGA